MGILRQCTTKVLLFLARGGLGLITWLGINEFLFRHVLTPIMLALDHAR